MKFECPVCKSNLIHRRVDDGFDSHKIGKNGKVICIASKSNGYDEVVCGRNYDHAIPEKLQDKVLNLLIYYVAKNEKR